LLNVKIALTASGYGRSEGVVVLLLQRSTDALRSYGTILHCDAGLYMEKAINFIRPSEDSFREFFKSFYEDCKISPANISYLESDGSGCKVLDYLFFKIQIVNKLCKNKIIFSIMKKKSLMYHQKFSAKIKGPLPY